MFFDADHILNDAVPTTEVMKIDLKESVAKSFLL